MADMTKFADELVQLSVTELLELKKILKDKYGLEEPAPIVVSAPEPEKKPVVEKTSFNVKLTKLSESTTDRLSAVKVINKFTQIGLKEAMALAKSFPVILKENVPVMEANAVKEELALLNTEVELY